MQTAFFYLFFYVYETEFVLRSLMALREEAPPQSLSLRHHAPEALARWQ